VPEPNAERCLVPGPLAKPSQSRCLDRLCPITVDRQCWRDEPFSFARSAHVGWVKKARSASRPNRKTERVAHEIFRAAHFVLLGRAKSLDPTYARPLVAGIGASLQGALCLFSRGNLGLELLFQDLCKWLFSQTLFRYRTCCSFISILNVEPSLAAASRMRGTNVNACSSGTRASGAEIAMQPTT
jgi:hypothetical protein